ncbi:putative metal-dependent hydrolase [[Clostridium] sordellii]|uniref:MBL fold metallo-hydrolase n=1 Tax=Paraclostridium sordellii TaxID=1505 RepID=UPI0005E63BF0|nr:MBL fold metallo-hydrolase [Paeniclostridium sordellii]CEQ22141.1 putative metal-dependent hydrolase [[Clostridium] sordellii] [Paeniclostridium sordellii]
MNTLTFLGRGSGYHSTEANTSAYIKENETLLLIDCGETVFKKILEKNLMDGVKHVHILITHMHSDHVGSLGGFIGFCFWKYKITSKVYFKEKEKIKLFLELLGLKENQAFEVLDPNNKRIEALGLNINCKLTKHVETLNTYSYILKFDIGNNIFYSGDTYETNIDIVEFLKAGNLVYHDTCIYDSKGNVHTSLRKLSELVPKEYRNQVYCIHIDGDNFIEEANKQGFNIVNIK